MIIAVVAIVLGLIGFCIGFFTKRQVVAPPAPEQVVTTAPQLQAADVKMANALPGGGQNGSSGGGTNPFGGGSLGGNRNGSPSGPPPGVVPGGPPNPGPGGSGAPSNGPRKAGVSGAG